MARKRKRRHHGGRHQPRPDGGPPSEVVAAGALAARGALITDLEVRPELYASFGEQFDAALALDAFAMQHRPPDPPQEPIDQLMFRMYARSTKTYQGSLRLTGAGYAIQASMLARSLFEDVLIAHWASAHSSAARQLYGTARDRELGKWRVSLEKHGREVPPNIPDVPEEERRDLYRPIPTWTGLSIWDLVNEVQDQWVDEVDRSILRQVLDFSHLFNTQQLHQTPLALELAVRNENDRSVADVGPSEIAVHNALMSSFWSYSQLVSLFAEGDALGELTRLFAHHWAAAFSEAGVAVRLSRINQT